LRVWLALLLFLSLPCSADNLVSLSRGTLPSLASPSPIALAVVDGHALSFEADAVWQLDGARREWTRSDWKPASPVRVVAGDGHRAFVLSGGDAVEQVDRLVFDGQVLAARTLPRLPSPLQQACAALSGNVLYVAGLAAGQPALVRIDVEAAAAAWEALPPWPGTAGPVALAAQGGGLYLALAGGPADALLQWNHTDGWTAKPDVPGRVLPGSMRALGQAHLLMLVRETSVPTASPVLMTFHAITGAWAKQAPIDAPGAVAATAWGNGLLWARGGSSDGETTFGYAELESGKLLLKWLDWIVIVVYLATMVGMGLYFYLREKRNSTSDFFVGGRTIPFWAAGISLYAANTSSISFIAIPAKAFETNWQYLTNNLIAVLGLMFVAVWIVPLLRRLDLMSVFSYLETRFHPGIRMCASALCIVMQIGSRMSVILFLPALAIATITGIDVAWSILLMGTFTILYTAMGGMKAVIWTDVVQVVVKMGGALFAIGFIAWHLHGGVGELVTTALDNHKTKLLDFSFDLTKATVWGFLFLVLFDVVLTFPKDQVLMQRTLSTKSDREAGRSIWAFALIMIPGGFVFYSIGTALFVYYKTHPERLDPLLPIDATFPLFIAAELPMGVTGMIIAGIFAAAMATLSSIMNSVATLASVDFYEKLARNPSPKKSVLFAEVATVATGLLGIGVALLLSRFDIHSLFDVSIELAGLLGGGFAGAYTLGMFTRRANSPGVAIGVASSIALTTVAWVLHLVHPYFYLAISIMLCIVIGYLASLFFPAPARSLDGLTIYSRSDRVRDASEA
jgi:SSS family transporter